MYPTLIRRAYSLGAALILGILLFHGVSAQTGELPSGSLQPTQDHEVFLPLVVKIAPAAPADLANGDFEAGRVAWTESSLLGYVLILQTADLPVTPHSGGWAAWLGGDHDEVSSIEQTFTIPATATQLTYFHWIASEDVCFGNYDTASVTINGNPVDNFTLCDDASTGGWVQRVVNVAAYAGQQVSLAFVVSTDSTLNSNLFIDDVALGS
jgi:hypothetical protein